MIDLESNATYRPFKCDFCDFRANQKSGLKCHQNSVQYVSNFVILVAFADCFPHSWKKRIQCRYPGCDRDYSDPSTLSRHMNKHHNISSKKLRIPSWVDLTSTFTIGSTSDPADATAVQSGGFRKFITDGNQSTKVERRSPDVSSANVTLHTSPQEGVSCQNRLLDSALFSFAPSPSSTPSPLLETPALHQPDLQFGASSNLYPSSGINIPSHSNLLPALSLPETNSTIMPPCGFEMPDVYGTPSKPAEQSADMYFHTLDDYLVQSSTNSSFSMAPNTIFPVPSVMTFPPMSNYDANCFGTNLLCEANQNWQFDTPALNFGYGDSHGTGYYHNFDGLNFLNF